VMKHRYTLLLFALLAACGKEEAVPTGSAPANSAAVQQETAAAKPEPAAVSQPEQPKPQSTPPAPSKLIEKYKAEGYQVENKHVFTREFEGIGQLTITPVTKFGFQEEFPLALILSNVDKEWVLTPKREDGHAMFSSFEAIAFKDIDEHSLKPGFTDIIVIANFITGAGQQGAEPFSEVFIFKNNTMGGFEEDLQLEQQIRESTDSRTLTMKQVLELARPVDVKRFVGTFQKAGSTEYDSAEVTIKSVAAEKLTFSLDAFHVNGGAKGAKSGSVNVGQVEEGIAKRNGNVAVFQAEDSNFTLTFTFFGNDTFRIAEAGGPYFGANVSASGLYKRVTK
jgi:hypothetical protein